MAVASVTEVRIRVCLVKYLNMEIYLPIVDSIVTNNRCVPLYRNFPHMDVLRI